MKQQSITIDEPGVPRGRGAVDVSPYTILGPASWPGVALSRRRPGLSSIVGLGREQSIRMYGGVGVPALPCRIQLLVEWGARFLVLDPPGCASLARPASPVVPPTHWPW
jgi:hypothetical protein